MLSRARLVSRFAVALAVLFAAGASVWVFQGEQRERERVLAYRAADHARALEHMARAVRADMELFVRFLEGEQATPMHDPALIAREFPNLASHARTARLGVLRRVRVRSPRGEAYVWRASGDFSAPVIEVELRLDGWRCVVGLDARMLLERGLEAVPAGGLHVRLVDSAGGVLAFHRSRLDPAARERVDEHGAWAASGDRYAVAALPAPLDGVRVEMLAAGVFWSRTAPRAYLVALVIGLILVGSVGRAGVLWRRALIARARLSASLRSRQRLMQRVLDDLPHPVSFIDADGRYRLANAALARMLGRKRREIVGMRVADCWGERVWRREIEPCFRHALEGRPVEHEFTHRMPDGDERAFMALFHPAPRAGGGGVIVSTVDITELRLAQQARLEAVRGAERQQRWAELGQLAGGIAHDINNLMMIVVGAAELLGEPGQDAGECSREILQAAERAADLCRNLLLYAGRHEPVRAVIRPEDVIRRVEPLLISGAGKGIEVRVEVPAGLPAIEGDPVMLSQMLQNLGANGIQAMSGRTGTLTLSVAEVDPGRFSWHGMGLPLPPRAVMIEVRDTGSGMDEEVRRRMFDPFFTTREEGTGLGLQVVRQAVEYHRGLIECDSRPGRGTRFRIVLPALPAGRVEESRPAPRPPRSARTVLLVEDEAGVRKMAAQFFERLGFRVREAADGAEGVAMLEKDTAGIDLVVMDVVMPGMSGVVALGRMKRIAPRVPVVLVSGYAESVPADVRPDAFLQKPYRLQALERVVADLLGNA